MRDSLKKPKKRLFLCNFLEAFGSKCVDDSFKPDTSVTGLQGHELTRSVSA